MGFEDAFEKAGIVKKPKEQKKQKHHNHQNRGNQHKPINKTHIANPSFYFYKDKAYGKDIEKFKLNNTYEQLFSIKDAKTFELTTTYPGLLVGSGYNHPKLKENDDDFQLGFFFDHTTGLPLISGSSIKGLLRSVLEKEEFCAEVYGVQNSKEIVKEYFENSKAIFYDAFIVKSNNKDNIIFGSDYITSHYSDELNGEFKNPNPIKFLKILPDVTFRFQFSLDDEKLLEKFKEIILDFGLGAKTNTGYGKFK
jgi:CRISPR-associated protein Cmr6